MSNTYFQRILDATYTVFRRIARGPNDLGTGPEFSYYDVKMEGLGDEWETATVSCKYGDETADEPYVQVGYKDDGTFLWVVFHIRTPFDFDRVVKLPPEQLTKEMIDERSAMFLHYLIAGTFNREGSEKAYAGIFLHSDATNAHIYFNDILYAYHYKGGPALHDSNPEPREYGCKPKARGAKRKAEAEPEAPKPKLSATYYKKIQNTEAKNAVDSLAKLTPEQKDLLLKELVARHPKVLPSVMPSL